MNIYPWYIFITVAEQKSFIKAASELNISPSSVSHAIAKLESECGYPLFIRNRNSIALTSSGQGLLPFVRQFLNCDNALTQEISKLKSIQSGGVKVAAFHSATLLWLPETIKDFRAEYPGVQIIMRQSGDKDINQMIQNGEIDLAIVSKEAIGPNVPFLPLHQTPVVGVTLSQERRIELAELANKYNVMVLEDDPYREIRYSGEEFIPIMHYDKNDNVIFAGSFSKIFSPVSGQIRRREGPFGFSILIRRGKIRKEQKRGGSLWNTNALTIP